MLALVVPSLFVASAGLFRRRVGADDGRNASAKSGRFQKNLFFLLSLFVRADSPRAASRKLPHKKRSNVKRESAIPFGNFGMANLLCSDRFPSSVNLSVIPL